MALILTKWRLLWQSAKPPVFGKRHVSAVASPESASCFLAQPIDEEVLHGDRLKYFHPTTIGQVLDGRLKTLVKLGFGAGSTVWLAEDLRL
ncbi:protein kinase domain protein [Niveomyces insectorum RCEF 264]|uniref:Protein kinase domain protein n=1 Tax=Niveomyces insectorum RCEF 264 TaxID=1081102 RepID=A0A167ZT19_9HYPO|nr:protein kinase domain protein [Niveomyces insectorum RCEF 264]